MKLRVQDITQPSLNFLKTLEGFWINPNKHSKEFCILRTKNPYKTSAIFLATITLALLVIAIVLSILYAMSARKTSKLCTTEECLRSSADLHRSMDLTADPCEDFYQFTCGRWDQVHVNQGWHSSFSIFEVIDDQVAMEVLKFLQTPIDNAEALPVKQSRWFYKSCLDQDGANFSGYKVLHKYLKESGLPIVPAFFKPSLQKFDWIKASAQLRKTFGFSMFVQFRLEVNNFNNTVYDFLLVPGNHATSLPSQLKEMELLFKATADEQDEMVDYVAEMKLKWKKYFSGVLESADQVPTDDKLEQAINIVWDLSSDIYTMSTGNLTGGREGTFTVQELQDITDECLVHENGKSFEYYKDYLSYLFEDIPGVSFDFKNDFIYVLENDFYTICKILAYVARLPDEILELYAWWNAVEIMILSTSTEGRDFANFNRPLAPRSRSRHCLGIVEQYMPLAVSYGIVDKGFVNNTAPKVLEMLEAIRTAFIERIGELKWMDQDTKEAAVEKAREMISFVGFPDWLLNRTALELYYSNLTIGPTTFLDNVMQFIGRAEINLLKEFGRPKKKDMRAPPIEANAYHFTSENSIHIPMAILTFPLYNLGLDVINYGAFGSILGHEFTHGFDSEGRNFDKEGNLFGWWTNNTDSIFEEKSKCFVDQYDNFYLSSIDRYVDGLQTLAENLADNGGLNNAYKAYQKANPEDLLLPGFEAFTKNQMFFIAFASVWCDVRADDELAAQVVIDSHSPNRFRVIGTLQNSKEFAEAFQCKLGSGMNPVRERCKIW